VAQGTQGSPDKERDDVPEARPVPPPDRHRAPDAAARQEPVAAHLIAAYWINAYRIDAYRSTAAVHVEPHLHSSQAGGSGLLW
jgi:hypothetical protein